MIRVLKNENAPMSLTTTKSYRGQDVEQQLIEDQHSKCYLCERTVVTDYQIEHLISQENGNDTLVQDWQNLLLACNYCNSKKQHLFDHLLNPLSINIEDEIKQEIDLDHKKALFSVVGECETTQHKQTIILLNLIFNGVGKIRKVREECFFKYVSGVYYRFSKNIADYIITPTDEMRGVIIEELDIKKELLGIKYWMIQSHPTLKVEFAPYMIWNKQPVINR